jgi:glyoxylase-like metal-dependent hydrolase (beta-lactamase superfamily II)
VQDLVDRDPVGRPEVGRRTLIAPGDALQALGIRPADVPTVVITHAHYDHIGNLELFPNARITIAEREVGFWRSAMARHPLFAFYAEASEIDQLATAERQGRLVAFAGQAEPAPGLLVTEVGGHTPGQSIVELSTSHGPVLIASDCVHFYEELDREMPFSAVTELPAMYAGFQTVRARLRSSGAHLVTGHDAATLDRFPRHTGHLRNLVSVIGSTTG